MYDEQTRKKIIELLPKYNSTVIARMIGVSNMGVENLRKRLGIPNPYWLSERHAHKNQPEVLAPEIKKNNKEWPCVRTHAEWPGCGHHVTCCNGRKCEAPGW